MKTIDPGHAYLLDSYDGGQPVRLTFVKREGEGYPFNAGHHPGTNCQEVIRALIDRVKYLQEQIPCEENQQIINNLRSCLWEFERRAAKRHGRASVLPWQEGYQAIPIENQPTCTGCGHVGCEGNHKATPTAAPVVDWDEDRCMFCGGKTAHEPDCSHGRPSTVTPSDAARERASIILFGADYDEVVIRNLVGNEYIDLVLERIAAALPSTEATLPAEKK